mgnify:CR=1 FL=1
MNIVILSRNKNLYSTKRLIEEAESRSHDVEVIDPNQLKDSDDESQIKLEL